MAPAVNTSWSPATEPAVNCTCSEPPLKFVGRSGSASVAVGMMSTAAAALRVGRHDVLQATLTLSIASHSLSLENALTQNRIAALAVNGPVRL